MIDRKAMYFSTHAIKINRESYQNRFQIVRFFRYLICVMLKGESPIQHRPLYARRARRF
jgi:hypothetical protein